MSRLSFALLLTVTLPLAPLCTGCTEEVTIAAPLDADGRAAPDGEVVAAALGYAVLVVDHHEVVWQV